MDNYIFTQNGDNNVQIGTDRLTGDFKGASMFATVEQARQYNRLRQYEDTGLSPDEIAALRAELDAAQRRADSAVGWADCIVDVMISSRRGIVEERFSALAGYRKWRETDRRGPDAPSKEDKQ